MERLAERVRVCLLKFVARVCEYEEEIVGFFECLYTHFGEREREGERERDR
jgi:hypothetical protein